MKKIFTSGFLPIITIKLSWIGRKKKNVRAFLVILLLLALSPLCYPQSPAIKQALEEYEKNMYPWKPQEYEQTTNDSILTVLGRWAWGPCHAVDVKDNYAYIGNGPTFHILDISDPTQPEIIGEFITEGYIYDMKVRDNTAFLAIGRGLLILDVTNPQLPKEISYIAVSGIALKLAVYDSFVYLVTFSRTMRIVDISEINNPVLRGIISTQARPISVVAKDGYVYVGNVDTPFLQIINAENPDSLTYTVFYTGKLGISSYIKDNMLFLGGSWFITHFMIYDISELSAPQFIGQAEIPDSLFIDAIAVSEDGLTAYALAVGRIVSSAISGVYSINIANLSQPVVLDKIEKNSDGPAVGIGISQDKVVAAYFLGALVIDASNPDSLKNNSFFPTGEYSQKVALKDNYAFVASGRAGLWIFDFSNPEKPKAIANFNVGSFTSDVIVEDTLVYIVNQAIATNPARGLFIINISDINNPKMLSHYVGNNTSQPNSITKAGDLVFITQAPTETNVILQIIDVKNLNEPKGLGIFQGNYNARRTAVKDTLVFLATSNGGLRIIDISHPNKPIELSNILNEVTGVAYHYPYVYTSSFEFSIININDPLNPFVVSSLHTHTGSFSVHLVVTNNYAYWAEGVLGVIDISNPENPTQITTFQGKDVGRGVAVNHNSVLFAAQSQGVWILRNNLVTNVIDDNPISHNYELSQNYPNPFNPSTIISFSIPVRERVELKIFNSLGQEVAALINKELEAGIHRIEFNAASYASGVYFYRLKTDNFVQTKKLLLLK